jgi:hypothetical protein
MVGSSLSGERPNPRIWWFDDKPWRAACCSMLPVMPTMRMSILFCCGRKLLLDFLFLYLDKRLLEEGNKGLIFCERPSTRYILTQRLVPRNRHTVPNRRKRQR